MKGHVLKGHVYWLKGTPAWVYKQALILNCNHLFLSIIHILYIIIQLHTWLYITDNCQWLNFLSESGGLGMTTNQKASRSSCLLLNGDGGLRKTTNQFGGLWMPTNSRTWL
jgi:hypothetical protein